MILCASRGRTGGKSTTIGIISSLVNKTGRVSVFGYDLEKDVVNAKRQVGPELPQEFNFNPFETVQQNCG